MSCTFSNNKEVWEWLGSARSVFPVCIRSLVGSRLYVSMLVAASNRSLVIAKYVSWCMRYIDLYVRGGSWILLRKVYRYLLQYSIRCCILANKTISEIITNHELTELSMPLRGVAGIWYHLNTMNICCRKIHGIHSQSRACSDSTSYWTDLSTLHANYNCLLC